jgi:hypothetical protein
LQPSGAPWPNRLRNSTPWANKALSSLQGYRARKLCIIKILRWDIVDRGFPGSKVRDFLTVQARYCNFVCNPPFGIAEQFVTHALKLARHTVAMLLPTIWLQGDRRSRWLETTPLKRVLFITPRPSMPPGAVIAAGQKPGNGTKDYAWLVWG